MKDDIICILSDINENFSGYTGTDMLKDEVLDSFLIMELIAQLEEIYHIELDADDIIAENFKTVDSIVAMIEKYVGMEK